MSIRFVQRPYRTSNLQSNTLKGTTAKGTVLADQESETPYIETGMEGVIASEQGLARVPIQNSCLWHLPLG